MSTRRRTAGAFPASVDDGAGQHDCALHDGLIGAGPFGALLGHPATGGVPFIVETPGGEKAHTTDIARLRALRETADPGAAGPG